MILGRPTNLWLGLITSVTGLGALVAAGMGHPIDATILASVGVVEGSLIAVVAYQPPTLNPGDTFHTTTPNGEPNYVTTVSTPPESDAPPVPTGDKP